MDVTKKIKRINDGFNDKIASIMEQIAKLIVKNSLQCASSIGTLICNLKNLD